MLFPNIVTIYSGQTTKNNYLKAVENDKSRHILGGSQHLEEGSSSGCFQFKASGLRRVFSLHLAKQVAHHLKALLDRIYSYRTDSTQMTKQKNIKTSLNFEVLPKKIDFAF